MNTGTTILRFLTDGFPRLKNWQLPFSQHGPSWPGPRVSLGILLWPCVHSLAASSPCPGSSLSAFYSLDSCLHCPLYFWTFVLRVPSHSSLQSFDTVQLLPFPTMFPSLNSWLKLYISKSFLLLTMLYHGCCRKVFSIMPFTRTWAP